MDGAGPAAGKAIYGARAQALSIGPAKWEEINISDGFSENMKSRSANGTFVIIRRVGSREAPGWDLYWAHSAGSFEARPLRVPALGFPAGEFGRLSHPRALTVEGSYSSWLWGRSPVLWKGSLGCALVPLRVSSGHLREPRGRRAWGPEKPPLRPRPEALSWSGFGDQDRFSTLLFWSHIEVRCCTWTSKRSPQQPGGRIPALTSPAPCTTSSTSRVDVSLAQTFPIFFFWGWGHTGCALIFALTIGNRPCAPS